MKYYSTLLALLICSVLHGAEALTNKISIHLLADKSAWDRTAKPYSLKAIAQPILSDIDFVAFDTTTHTFTITAEAAKRLVMKFAQGDPSFKSSGETFYAWDGGDTPFLLMTSGEPIYVGVFKSPFSAVYYYWGVPTVLPSDGISVRAFTNATFRIDLGHFRQAQRTNGFLHPQALRFPGEQSLEDYWRRTDVRNDSRIVPAVQTIRTETNLTSRAAGSRP